MKKVKIIEEKTESNWIDMALAGIVIYGILNVMQLVFIRFAQLYHDGYWKAMYILIYFVEVLIFVALTIETKKVKKSKIVEIEDVNGRKKT